MSNCICASNVIGQGAEADSLSATLRISHNKLRSPSIGMDLIYLTSRQGACRPMYSGRPNGLRGDKEGKLWEEVIVKERRKETVKKELEVKVLSSLVREVQ